LYGAPGQNFPQIVLADGGSSQQQFTQFSNPAQPPATATIWTGGVVFTPKDVRGLAAFVDYYNIDNPDIATYDWQGYANSLNTFGSASPFAPSFTFADGTKLTTPGPNQVTSENFGNGDITRTPGATQRTDGFDVGISYEHDFADYGRFYISGMANIILNYEFSSAKGAPFSEYSGQYTDIFAVPGGQGTLPDYNIAMTAAWEWRDFTLSAYSRYIPEVDDLGAMHPSVGEPEHGSTIDGKAWTVDSWFTIDLQAAYEFNRGKPISNWYDGIRVAVGCNNVSDEDVPLVASANEDNTDKGTYNILGRLVYFQVSKKF
jgi:hypothetical protein